MRIRIALLASIVAICALADDAAGIHWTPPSSWQSQGSRPMRAATYSVPAAAGDSEPGECGAYYFGQGQGGSVADNIKRWIGQFEGGQTNAKTGERIVHGLTVHTIDVSGTYSGMGGPMAPSHTAKPNYRLLGAIVEAPQGSVFFKFTGPSKTVAANQAKFDAMLDSLAK